MKLFRLATLVVPLITGCAQSDFTRFTAPVSNVRMTFEKVAAERGDDGAAGLIVGGLTAGLPGAIVGGALTSREDVPAGGRLVACSFRAAGKDFRFSGAGSGYIHLMRICSTLRDGDVLNFYRENGNIGWDSN